MSKTSKTVLILLILILAGLNLPVLASSDERQKNFQLNQIFVSPSLIDSNVAFFEGDQLNYIFKAPGDLVLFIDEAISHGYSLSFVENNKPYDSSEIQIDITIINIKKTFKKFRLSKFVSSEIKEIKKHFGDQSEINLVDSLPNQYASNKIISIYFINHPTQFIPNVMIAYFSDGKELIIFELSISDGYLRVEAEQMFIQLLEQFKSLKKQDKDKLAENQ